MTASGKKFLIFSVQGSPYAFDLSHMAEVCDPPPLWPIPLAPSCYSGALSFHGDIVAVINLALFLGLPDTGKAGKIVVLRQELASLAFLVDAIVRIVPENEISFTDPPENRFACATLGLSDGSAILLDPDTLVHEAGMRLLRSR